MKVVTQTAMTVIVRLFQGYSNGGGSTYVRVPELIQARFADNADLIVVFLIEWQVFEGGRFSSLFCSAWPTSYWPVHLGLRQGVPWRNAVGNERL